MLDPFLFNAVAKFVLLSIFMEKYSFFYGRIFDEYKDKQNKCNPINQ